MSDLTEFTGLDPEQNKFLAYRLRHSSDKAAAEAIGLHYDKLEAWKRRDTAFMVAYRGLNSDGVRLAQRITREDLGLAALTLRQGLEATRPVVVNGRLRELPDFKERREAAITILKVHGVLNDRLDIHFVMEEARRIAEQLGLDERVVLAEAERIIGTGVGVG